MNLRVKRASWKSHRQGRHGIEADAGKSGRESSIGAIQRLPASRDLGTAAMFSAQTRTRRLSDTIDRASSISLRPRIEAANRSTQASSAREGREGQALQEAQPDKREIMDRMREQQEEEQREKDEVEAQKRREVRARRPAVPRRFHAIDATRLHQTRYSDRVTTATPRADRGRKTGRVRPREDGFGRS